MSLRNLAEASGKGIVTVRKALYLLAERGFISRGKGDSRGGEIRLLYPPAAKSDENQNRSKDLIDSKISPSVDLCVDIEPLFDTSPGGDAFRHGALNASGWRILDALARFGPLTPKELHEITGIPRATITRALKRLREAEAVSQEGRKYIAQAFDVTAIAEHYGTDGRQARQMARHEKDRAVWKAAQREHKRLKHPRNQRKAPAPQVATSLPKRAPVLDGVSLAEKWTGNLRAPAGVDPWSWYRQNEGRVVRAGGYMELRYPQKLAAFVRKNERELKIAGHREWEDLSGALSA